MLLALVPLLVPVKAGAVDVLYALRAHALVGERKLSLVDLRSAAERASFGVPQGAAWVEWHGVEGVEAFGRALIAAFPEKDTPIAFICSVGHRSGQAARVAEHLGYARVYDVAEGMNGAVIGPGWKAWGLPLEQSD